MKARLYFARGHKSGFARLALAVVASLFVATSLAEDNEPIFSDCHLHLLDFLQNGEFLNEDGKYPGDEWGITEDGRYSALPYGDRGRRIQAVLKGLNRARVGHGLDFRHAVRQEVVGEPGFQTPEVLLGQQFQSCSGSGH